MTKTQMVFSLTVTLRYIDPKITRRIEVPADVTLYDLHRILQITI